MKNTFLFTKKTEKELVKDRLPLHTSMCPAMNWEGKNNNIKSRTAVPLLGSIPTSFSVYCLFQIENENRGNSRICFLMEGGSVSASSPCASLTRASQTHFFQEHCYLLCFSISLSYTVVALLQGTAAQPTGSSSYVNVKQEQLQNKRHTTPIDPDCFSLATSLYLLIMLSNTCTVQTGLY